MLDIKFIRENTELIKQGAIKKHIDFDVEELIKVDDRRRELLSSIEQKRAEQNTYTEKIANESDEVARATMIDNMRRLKDDMRVEEDEMREVIKSWQMLMVTVPNIPDMSVPDGVDDSQNIEVKEWGEPTVFDFKPKNHIDLMENLNMVDFERGVKVAGFRGYFLKNDGAMLSFAIWQFVLDKLIKKGFNPIIAPSMIKRDPFMGTGYLPQSEEDLYKTQDEGYLAGTAEVPTMGYYMDEVLEKKNLPIKCISFSPCFRREAGSHGKDTKGLMRVHEFFKLEQVVLCEASHTESVKFHEELTENAEEIMKELEIPYHVVVNCGGDLGLGQVKKYDIEAWIPSESKYRETHSSSYFHDFQSRRLNIRYKEDDGKMKFVHSLNNTAIATPRILISIVENYQQADGSIKVPEVLRQYIGKDFIGK